MSKKKITDPEGSMEELIARAVEAAKAPFTTDRKAELPSLRSVAEELGTTVIRTRKLLITAGYFTSPTATTVQRMKGEGKTIEEIDVQMMSDDFEQFCKYAKSELSYPNFLQYWDTEKGFYPWHAKLRRSDTTCFSEWELKMNPEGNHGIFIDIFPLYNMPDGVIKYKIQTIRLKILKFFYECYEVDRALTKKRVRRTFKRFLAQMSWKVCSIITAPEKICCRYIKIASSEKRETRKIGVTTYTPGYRKYTWERRFFEKTVELPFEDRTISAPYMYKERLTVQYGDWNKIVKNSENHSTLIFSSDITYVDYLNHKRGHEDGN